MEFILMAYVQEGGWENLTPEQQKQGMAAYTAYTRSLADAGVLMVNRRLGSSGSSRTLRGNNGNTQILDGPYTDSKEQLGGFYIINVNNRAEAMRWAAKCPAVGHGVLEVREIPAQ
ncbi:MAG TPA: YciI family protein [Candidatus Acidoferrum sp.]|nr:YciI family protein [Candidatus Acidoferrum sp.]